MSIWNGFAKLENVHFLQDAFISHHIPLSVKEGIIGSISFNFPWNKLSSQPCIINIDDIFACCDIKGKALITNDLQVQQPQQTQQQRVTEGEQNAQNQQKEEQSYIKSVSNQIINNLEINLNNIHILH